MAHLRESTAIVSSSCASRHHLLEIEWDDVGHEPHISAQPLTEQHTMVSIWGCSSAHQKTLTMRHLLKHDLADKRRT